MTHYIVVVASLAIRPEDLDGCIDNPGCGHDSTSPLSIPRRIPTPYAHNIPHRIGVAGVKTLPHGTPPLGLSVKEKP